MARPKLAPEGESVRVQVVVPAALAVALDGWGLEHGIGKRSESARLLLAAALDPKNADGGRRQDLRPSGRIGDGHPNQVQGSEDPSGVGTRIRSSSAPCPPHPVGRRIGDGCGACGDEKAWRKR